MRDIQLLLGNRLPLRNQTWPHGNWKSPINEGFNVSSCLVARLAIVANFLQIILKLMYCLGGLLLWQNKMGVLQVLQVLQALQVLQVLQILQVLQVLQVIQIPQLHRQKNSFN